MTKMNGDFIERLRLISERLTYTDGHIAENFVKHAHTYVNYSITQIADEIGVSNSSISRFARKLGYSGFIELRTSLKFLSVNFDNFTHSIAKYTLLVNDYANLMNNFVHSLDFQKIQRIVRLMNHSKRIVVLGLGNSGNIAHEFASKLTYLGLHVSIGDDADSIVIQSRHASPNDVLIFFSRSGTSTCIQKGISFCVENNAHAVLITTNQAIDTQGIYTLVLPKNEDYVSGTNLSNQIPQLFVADILYRELINCNPRKYNKALTDTHYLFDSDRDN